MGDGADRGDSNAAVSDGAINSLTGSEFVGRDRELRVLLEALARAQSGRGSLFLIGGEPGIGKSRLTDEFTIRARHAGARILWGRAWEGAGAPSYWAWIQILRGHLRGVHPDQAREQLAYGAADIAQMLPEIRALVPDLPAPPPESDSARFQLFDSTVSFLRNIARDQPTVLVIDDLHAADTPSILLLRFLASQLGEMAMVAVATYRDVELTPEHPLVATLGEMIREPITRTITLGGLEQPEIARLVEIATGQRVDAHLASSLWRGTNGNPLFLREAVRLLSSEGRLNQISVSERRQLALPAGVRSAIERRISQLGEPTIRALTYGAALGPEFSAEVVRRVGRYTGDELLDVLGQAIEAGVLGSAALGRYRFSHDLIREALYERLDPSDRVRLHRLIAESLDELYRSSPEAHVAELAHHYFEAARGAWGERPPHKMRDVVSRAKDYARRAGDDAARSLAYEEAERLYRMALETLDLAEPRDDIERTGILLALGDVQTRAGDLLRAQPTFRTAAQVARRVGAGDELARAVLGYSGRFFWTRAGNDPGFVRMLQDALESLGTGDDPLRVRLMTRLATAWRDAPDRFADSDALSAEAVAIARRLDDPATLTYALGGRFWAIYWPHTTAERYALAREMLAVAEVTGDAELIIDAHMNLSFVFGDVCRMAEAKAEIETLTRIADELRQPAQLWLARAVRCAYALLEGDYSLAERLIEIEIISGSPTTPVRDDVSAASMHRFLLARERGGLQDQEGAVRTAVLEFPWYPVHRSALICLLLDAGRESEARSLFADVAKDDFAALLRDNEWLVAASLAGDAAASLGDAKAAAILYAQLELFAGLHAIAYGEGSVGVVDRYLGLLAAVLGRLDQAERHLMEAIRLNGEMGAHPWRAHSEHDLAQLLRRRSASGDETRAEELERTALETARRLGMTVLERIVEGGRGPQPRAEPPEVRHAGTFRAEGEYWTIEFGDDSFRLRDAKGLHYLARLVAEPAREFLALDLARQVSVEATVPSAVAEDVSATPTDAGAALDAQAKSAYRERLHELQTELDEAEAWHDAERAERARDEMEFIGSELARAIGLGGRDRVAGSATERARLSVTRAIRSAMERIAAHSRSLGDHLERSIHTGTYCAYRPDPGLSIEWRVRQHAGSRRG